MHAEIVVHLIVAKQVIDDDQDGVAQRDGSFLLSPADLDLSDPDTANNSALVTVNGPTFSPGPTPHSRPAGR